MNSIRPIGESCRSMWFWCLLAIAVSGRAFADSPGWVAVSKDTLDGIGVPVNENAAEEGLPNSYFRELEPAVHPKFGLIHADRMQTAIVETPGEITRSLAFPGDEVVHLQSGRTILVDDATGQVSVARAGDYFVVPAHWRGLWIFQSDGDKPAREHAMVMAADYASTKPALNAQARPKIPPAAVVYTPRDIEAMQRHLKPISFESPAARAPQRRSLLGHVIFAGDPSFLMLASNSGGSFVRPSTRCESVVRVVAGSVTLTRSGGETKTFGPEDVFVVTKDFSGTVRLDRGFKALSVVTTGDGTPAWPAKVAPAVSSCPAL